MSNGENNAIRPININPGAEVVGEDFFGREKELERLLEFISRTKGSVVIPGPRRWGKSSLIKEFMRRNAGRFEFLFLNLQSVHDIKQFYIRFIEKLKEFNEERGYNINTKTGIKMKKFLNTITELINEVSAKGIAIKPGSFAINTYELFSSLENAFKCFYENNIILVLDEISDFVIDVKKNAGEMEAVNFLKWLRTLRQELNIKMILTGSVNILSEVKKLKAEDAVNDLVQMILKPLKQEESIILFKSLLKSKNISITGEALKFSTFRIKNGVHYFIQLFADQICTECTTGEGISDNRRIEKIYMGLINTSSPSLSSFYTRLSRYLTSTEEKAAREILTKLCFDPLDFETLFAIAGNILDDDRHKLRSLLYRLQDEGYIIEGENGYCFISVILCDYWKKHCRC